MGTSNSAVHLDWECATCSLVNSYSSFKTQFKYPFSVKYFVLNISQEQFPPSILPSWTLPMPCLQHPTYHICLPCK